MQQLTTVCPVSGHFRKLERKGIHIYDDTQELRLTHDIVYYKNVDDTNELGRNLFTSKTINPRTRLPMFSAGRPHELISAMDTLRNALTGSFNIEPANPVTDPPIPTVPDFLFVMALLDNFAALMGMTPSLTGLSKVVEFFVLEAEQEGRFS
jgi:hypothetical protein